MYKSAVTVWQMLYGAAIVTLVSISPAYAYLDPGTGSVLVTTILGFFAAIGFTFRKYFYKISGLVRSKKSKSNSSENEDENNISVE